MPRSGSLRDLEVEERAVRDLQPQSIPRLAIFLQEEGKPPRPLDDPPGSVCPLQRGDLVVRQNAIRQRELQGASLLQGEAEKAARLTARRDSEVHAPMRLRQFQALLWAGTWAWHR
mmetsp:Transcript_1836/g.3824  ORF Transcript_1836/g.3824 Transcript_1836/m.3824 type:complete len:116 (-) Transcript_1836:185-532(-)